MLLKDLTEKFEEIKNITDAMKSGVFRVVDILNGFYIVLYLSETLDNIELDILDSNFTKIDLNLLPLTSFPEYTKIRFEIQDFIDGKPLSIPEESEAKNKFIRHFRKHRKDINLYGIKDIHGDLL